MLHLLIFIVFSLPKNDILQFQSAPAEPTINPDSICKDFSSLQPHQKSICRRYPHATASGMQGELLVLYTKVLLTCFFYKKKCLQIFSHFANLDANSNIFFWHSAQILFCDLVKINKK